MEVDSDLVFPDYTLSILHTQEKHPEMSSLHTQHWLHGKRVKFDFFDPGQFEELRVRRSRMLWLVLQ